MTDGFGRATAYSKREFTFAKNGSPYAIRPLSVLSVCDVGVLWPNGWTGQDETWHAGRLWPQPLAT